MVKPALPYLDIIADAAALAPDHLLACPRVLPGQRRVRDGMRRPGRRRVRPPRDGVRDEREYG